MEEALDYLVKHLMFGIEIPQDEEEKGDEEDE